MSNKQARRAASAPVTRTPAPSLAFNSTDTLGRRLRGGTGALIVGGAIAVVGTLLPWFDVAGGTTVAGVGTVAGIGTLVLAVAAGLLISIAGGVVATTGCRALLARS